MATAMAVALLVAGCGPLPDVGALQERTEVPAEQLSAGHSLGQTFVASQPGLSAVEVILAVYPPEQGSGDGDLIISLREAVSGAPVLAELRLPVAGLTHNARQRLSFAPQPDSAGRAYLLQVEATTPAPSRVTVWMADDDAYRAGTRHLDGQPVAGDLSFRAFYDYDAASLAGDLAGAIARSGWVFLPALAALLLPGLAVALWLLRDADFDPAEWLGVALGLSLAVAPLLLLGFTVAGARLGPPTVVALLAFAAVAVLAWLCRRQARPAPCAVPSDTSSLEAAPARLRRFLLSPAMGVFIIAAGALVLRFVHAKDMALPLWVDSVHHTLIANLIAESGQVPVDYGPHVPPQPYTYHFGFHIQVVFLHWLSGMDSARAVLFIGQLLGGLIVFPAYLLSARLAGSRLAGLATALLVGLVSTMPAYYVSWGRYPQLAGLAVLPVAALLAARLHTKGRGLVLVPLVAVAFAGQALTHPRVALLLIALVAADFVARDWRRVSGETLAAFVAAGGATVVLLLPWLARLASSRPGGMMVVSGVTPLSSFPVGILTMGADRYLLAAAAGGLVLGLLWRRRGTLVVLLWLVFAFALANTTRLGLPVFLHLSNEALAIALFLPVAILAGFLFAGVLELARFPRWPRAAQALPLAALAVLGLWGGQNLAGIVNPVCILATGPDVEALRWVEENTAPSARFLINSRVWQGDMHSGTDAGYWLPALAGREATLPPLVYDHGEEAAVERIRTLAEWTEQQAGKRGDELRPTLLANGITHVFIGSRGGPLVREMFEDVPGYRLTYSNGEAWVFEVLPAS